MKQNLGQRLKGESAWIIYNSREGDANGISPNLAENVDHPMYSCGVRENISRLSWTSITMPRDLRHVLWDPNNRGRELINGKTLVALHYKLNKKRHQQEVDRRNDMNRRVGNYSEGQNIWEVLETDKDISCLYTNFMGEILFAGPQDFMQQVVDYSKQGVHQALEVLSDWNTALPDPNFSLLEQQITKYNSLYLVDTVKRPKVVDTRKR